MGFSIPLFPHVDAHGVIMTKGILMGSIPSRSFGAQFGKMASMAAVLTALAWGCQTPRPLAVTGHTDTRPIEHRDNTNIVAVDCGLTGISHGDVQIARQHTEWSPDGRLKISVEIENRTPKDLPVQIQTAFKDSSDNFLSDQTPYKTAVLPRNATYLYEATALNKNAEKAHVRIRYAKPQ
jgi:hypothetical protein